MSDKLNAEQRAAVESAAPRRLVLAGPGSGKSRCLVAAVQREAAERGAAGIVVLSYTNAAAQELQDRLAALGVVGLGFVGTLHAFLFRCLAEMAGRPLTVLDDEARGALVEQVAEDLGVRTPIKKLVELLDNFNAVKDHHTKDDMVCLDYYSRLVNGGLVDFGSILRGGIEAVKKLAAAGKWRYTALFADEIQDSAQPDWCFYGTAPFERKYITGDGDQSVYSFRGGRPDILVKLAEDAENPKSVNPKPYEMHLLEGNYRCSPYICKAANTLIAYNKNRIPKLTISERKEGIEHLQSPTVQACDTPAAELHWVLDNIIRQAQEQDLANNPNGRHDWSQVAVLARTNWLARSFADHLKANGVPVATVERERRPADWRKAKLVLAAMADPWNDVAVSAALRATADKHAERMATAAASVTMCSISEAAGWVFGKGDARADDLLRFQVGSESREMVHDAARELGRRGAWTLGDLLVYLGQQDDVARVAGHGVTCCTIHAAKGREWGAVFVVGCEEGLLPSRKDAGDAAALEEARRLMFVAMTRAKDSLSLSWCRERPESRGPDLPPGPMRPRERSRFVAEVGL